MILLSQLMVIMKYITTYLSGFICSINNIIYLGFESLSIELVSCEYVYCSKGEGEYSSLR